MNAAEIGKFLQSMRRVLVHTKLLEKEVDTVVKQTLSDYVARRAKSFCDEALSHISASSISKAEITVSIPVRVEEALDPDPYPDRSW